MGPLVIQGYRLLDALTSSTLAYGGSQARGLIGATATSLPMSQPQQHQIQVASVTYTTAHGNTGSLTH